MLLQMPFLENDTFTLYLELAVLFVFFFVGTLMYICLSLWGVCVCDGACYNINTV